MYYNRKTVIWSTVYFVAKKPQKTTKNACFFGTFCGKKATI